MNFQLTTSRRGRPISPAKVITKAIFQLTTSRRGRPFHAVDGLGIIDLSTHDLTQRSTLQGSGYNTPDRLSTHDLTQRSTYSSRCGAAQDYLSTHDLTQRSTVLLLDGTICITAFNSRPHAEVDIALCGLYIYQHLSTHDLTQRSTISLRMN